MVRLKHMIHWGKMAWRTLTSSLTFFYGHLSLVALSLVPSSFRAYQMWHHLDTPFWMEVAVELTRVVLFLMMIAFLADRRIHHLKQKEFWIKLGQKSSTVLQESWPWVFIAQILVFLVVLYGIMNWIILFFVGVTFDSIIKILAIGEYDPEAARNAYLFFLKNMSVIPLSMVYMLKMFGIAPLANESAE